MQGDENYKWCFFPRKWIIKLSNHLVTDIFYEKNMKMLLVQMVIALIIFILALKYIFLIYICNILARVTRINMLISYVTHICSMKNHKYSFFSVSVAINRNKKMQPITLLHLFVSTCLSALSFFMGL